MEEDLVIQPPDVRIEIDLNSRSRDGYVLARISRANGPVLVDDQLVAYEPCDRVAAPARVVRVDRQHDFVYLDVDWVKLDHDRGHTGPPQPIAADAKVRHSNAASTTTMRLRLRQHVWAALSAPKPSAH